MTIYPQSSVPIVTLIEDIDRGKIGLTELQRFFVWRKVTTLPCQCSAARFG